MLEDRLLTTGLSLLLPAHNVLDMASIAPDNILGIASSSFQCNQSGIFTAMYFHQHVAKKSCTAAYGCAEKVQDPLTFLTELIRCSVCARMQKKRLADRAKISPYACS